MQETAADDGDQGQDERLHQADAAVLQPQEQKRVGAVMQHGEQQRHAEEQLQADGGAQHLRQVAGGDGDLAQDPQSAETCARIGFAAGLGQVQAGDDSEPGAEVWSRMAMTFDMTSTQSSW